MMRLSGVAFLALVVAMGTAASAFAADLIVMEEPAIPIEVSTSADWDGFYLGIAAGGFWASADSSGPGSVGNESFDFETEGGVASLYAGYNWQLDDMFVLGVEGEVSWLDLVFEGNRNPGPWDYLTADWSGALSVRGGMLVTPEVLLYGKLGYSVTNFEAGTWGGDPVIEDGLVGAVVAGIGAEAKISENVILRGEVAHNFGLEDVSIDYGGGSLYVYTPSYTTAKVGIAFQF